VRTRLALGAVAMSILGALSLPPVAHAAAALANYTPVVADTPLPSRAYTITTSTPHWSVVAVRPPAGADYDLALSNGVKSWRGGSVIDFVAIKPRNCHPYATFTATVERYSGTGKYAVEFAQGSDQLEVDPLPFPDTNVHVASIFGPGINTDDHFVGVRDVYLHANRPVEAYAAHVGGAAGEVFVMPLDSSPGFCVRTRSQALASGTINQGGHNSLTLRFTPSRTGWYGFVQVTYGPDPKNGYSSLRVGQAAA
jgi:hypothetical protein